MSISQKVLRSLIREILLKETPLIDMPVYPYYSSSDFSISHPFNRSQKGNYEAKAKELMKNTKDNWVLMTGPFSFSKPVEDYEKWIEGKNYPPGTLVIFVDSSPMKGDYDTPIWQIVHDIFGHSILSFFTRKEVEDIGDTIAKYLLRLLPKEYQNIWDPEGNNDALSTVLGAIFTGKLKRQRVDAALPKYMNDIIAEVNSKDFTSADVMRCVATMFTSVEAWTQDLRNDAINAKGGVKVNFISPW